MKVRDLLGLLKDADPEMTVYRYEDEIEGPTEAETVWIGYFEKIVAIEPRIRFRREALDGICII